jgi:hypothetical protein
MRLFHYTTFPLWKQIQASNTILPATLYVPPQEKPVVWFSFRQDWEPTASPATIKNGQRVTLTFNEVVQARLVPCRIEISPRTARLNWRAWRKLSGVKSRTVKGLEQVAIEMGANVRDWRMTFDAVNGKDWIAVEGFIGGTWMTIGRPSAQ